MKWEMMVKKFELIEFKRDEPFYNYPQLETYQMRVCFSVEKETERKSLK